jgi:hypothetical protein
MKNNDSGKVKVSNNGRGKTVSFGIAVWPSEGGSIRISHDVSPRGTVRVRKPQAGDPKDYVRLHKFFEKILKNHLSPRVYRSANR